MMTNEIYEYFPSKIFLVIVVITKKQRTTLHLFSFETPIIYKNL